MRDYRFCVALRRADGALDEPVHEEVITAEDGASAIALAKAIDVNMLGLRANAIYLVPPTAMLSDPSGSPTCLTTLLEASRSQRATPSPCRFAISLAQDATAADDLLQDTSEPRSAAMPCCSQPSTDPTEAAGELGSVCPACGRTSDLARGDP